MECCLKKILGIQFFIFLLRKTIISHLMFLRVEFRGGGGGGGGEIFFFLEKQFFLIHVLCYFHVFSIKKNIEECPFTFMGGGFSK